MRPAAESVPVLRRGYRLQYEPAQGCRVLLYPEGMVRLNDSAGEVLALVDGERPVAAIVQDLQARFPEAEGIEQDILEFLETAHGEHWIEFH